MVKYETIIVYSLAKGEEAAKEVAEKFKAMIEGSGTVESIDEWGKRRLAYPINDENDGTTYSTTTSATLSSQKNLTVLLVLQMAFFVHLLLKSNLKVI